ncbi:hypothetical protein [Amycolatopsis magusensis]|uniref:DNA-3-methyladenine glycosylase II n=1 Tax=Amycolatopsis magusensis TaxID=882444 RepID=A0ABS4Q4W2_9PSEU|nr:hypothetical protein [Amycolatopsis magusensis]MBP2186724.1 DNA-3-methyladenine glycosylase II [Amycolatopsis magusensis]
MFTAAPQGLTVSNSIMMLDHPAWLGGPDGRARRVVRSAGAVWSVVCKPEGRAHAIDVDRLAGDPGTAPVVDVIDPAALTGDDVVCGLLRAEGPVARLRNPDVWDALGTSVIRQVIRAGQARLLYRRFCQAHGERYETTAGPAWLFPDPDVVLALSDDEFAALGMKFFRRGLRAAAEASLKFADEWTGMPGTRLVAEVQSVSRIGPWTAGATVADVTNDFSFYPFADLAVRTWAGTLAPAVSWPETEREFGRTWQAMAGTQLSERTLLTLAWRVRHATGVAL